MHPDTSRDWPRAVAMVIALLILAFGGMTALTPHHAPAASGLPDTALPPTFTIECTGIYGGANGITAWTDGGFYVDTQSGPSYLPIVSPATALPPAGIAWLQAEEDSAPLTAPVEYDCRYATPAPSPVIPDTAMSHT